MVSHYSAANVAWYGPNPDGLVIYNDGRGIHVQGDFGRAVVDGDSYVVKQFQFHAPSEHKTKSGLTSKEYDMEMHIVHQKEGALGYDDMMVVAVLFDTDADNDDDTPSVASEFLQRLGWDDLPAVGRRKLINMNQNGTYNGELKPFRLNLEDELMDELGVLNGRFWFYNGSLTTPPCSETVKWFVMQTLAPVSEAQVTAYEDAVGTDETARDDNGLNGRAVLDSLTEITPWRTSGTPPSYWRMYSGDHKQGETFEIIMKGGNNLDRGSGRDRVRAVNASDECAEESPAGGGSSTVTNLGEPIGGGDVDTINATWATATFAFSSAGYYRVCYKLWAPDDDDDLEDLALISATHESSTPWVEVTGGGLLHVKYACNTSACLGADKALGDLAAAAGMSKNSAIFFILLCLFCLALGVAATIYAKAFKDGDTKGVIVGSVKGAGKIVKNPIKS